MRAEEKSILVKFVSLYYISTFLFLSVIAVLIYNMQYQMIYNLTISNMETASSKISSKIITCAMKGKKLNFKSLCSSDKGVKFSLYNKTQNRVFSDIKQNKKIDFSKKHYIDGQHVVVIDKSALGHLNIYSVVMINDDFNKKVNDIFITILIGFILFYVAVCMVGYYLIQLFMKPIENERKRLDNFIKDTTHELNTPITALMICTSKETIKNEKNNERIYLSAKRISEIYKDLTYIFLDNTKNTNKHYIELNNIIIEELKYFEILANKKNISIKTDLEHTTLHINTEDLKRILSNLISNAIKYNNRGGNIDILLSNNVLKIKDNGIGIAKDKLENIFKKYFRATTQDGGFGMGLNIVYNICELNDIKIDVQSELRIGTTFKLEFKINS